MQFSVTTTEPSTMVPKSMAPRLMRFTDIPNRSIPTKPNRRESGIVKATTSAARQSPRKMSRMTTTRTAASSRFFRTVEVVASITSD